MFGSLAPGMAPPPAMAPGMNSPLLDMAMKMQRMKAPAGAGLAGLFARPQQGQNGMPTDAPANGGGIYTGPADQPGFAAPPAPAGGQPAPSPAAGGPMAPGNPLARLWGSLAPGGKPPAPLGIDPNSGLPITPDVAQGAAAMGPLPTMMPQGGGMGGW